MQIDWEAVRALLPVDHYVYHVEREGRLVEEFWYPHRPENKTFFPPKGWALIVRKDSAEHLMKAVDDWMAAQTGEKPVRDEKAVWYDNSTGEFSNSFDYRTDAEALKMMGSVDRTTARLIVYRSLYDENFEFSDLMKIVTNTNRRK